MLFKGIEAENLDDLLLKSWQPDLRSLLPGKGKVVELLDVLREVFLPALVLALSCTMVYVYCMPKK